MVQNGNIKKISDYAYWDAINEENLEANIRYLRGLEYFKDNFLTQNDDDVWVNINEVSSIKFSDKKLRVIMNLSHPVTFVNYNGDSRITSEFVYVNCKTKTEYEQYCTYIKETMEME